VHRGVLANLDAVVPSLPVEVVEAAVPLHEEVGPHEPAERGTVARVPRHLRRAEQGDGVALELVGREVGIVLGRLRRRRPHARVPLAHLAPVADGVHTQVQEEEPEQPEEDQDDDRIALAAAGGPAAAEAAAAPASAASTEAGASAAGLGDMGEKRAHRAPA
jgi:hypothetical protein